LEKKMKRSLSICAALVALVCATSAQADDLDLDLEYNSSTNTWELYAAVVDNAGPNSGDNGIAAVRAMIDNVDYGTNGDAVTIPSGIGAINPVMTSSGDRPPVLQTAGGTLDILYGQDISVAAGVVGGVGVGGRALIASGTYSGAAPAFGDDDQGLTSDANFLAVAAPGTQTAAYAPDNINLDAIDVGVGSIPGDYDASGQVAQGDLDLVLGIWGQTVPPVPAAWVNQVPSNGTQIGQTELDGVLLNWGNTSLAGSAASSVPEPGTFVLGGLALLGLAARRRNS